MDSLPSPGSFFCFLLASSRTAGVLRDDVDCLASLNTKVGIGTHGISEVLVPRSIPVELLSESCWLEELGCASSGAI